MDASSHLPAPAATLQLCKAPWGRRLASVSSQLQQKPLAACTPPATLHRVGTAAGQSWVRVVENERCIGIETEEIEATIPKRDPKHWMTGIEKGSFVDKQTGFREIGDGLMVIDWLMEAGSDEGWGDNFDHSTGAAAAGGGSGGGIGGTDRYLWHDASWVTNPGQQEGARLAHGTSHRKRAVEGPQLCHRMPPVQPTVLHGPDFVAVETTFAYEYAAPGRNTGSTWTQRIVFPRGKRYFVLMDQVECVNDSPELFLRNDTPGCVRHTRGDTFSEMYLSYLSGPNGVVIPASEFFEPFPPDLKFGYRRDTHQTPQHFIRAYHTRNPISGAQGPWLGGITLSPEVVYEAWASQRPGDIIVMILEMHGRPTKAGDTFSATHIVGWFDEIEEMHALADKHHGCTMLTADKHKWELA